MMRVIVGISGASGVILGVELLKALGNAGCETHLVVTRNARETMRFETDMSNDDIQNLASFSHSNDDLTAPISSGSYKTDGMVVIPCSMKTTAGIVTGYSSSLLLRAADVCLKEQRKLVLVPRETPMNVIHLKNLYQAARAGCVVIPMMMTFYNQPCTIGKMTNYLIGKVMSQFGIENNQYPEWQGGNQVTGTNGSID